MRIRSTVASSLLIALSWSARAEQATLEGRYVATAYAQSGTTASGIQTKRHVVAADPDILPIGSRIKIRHAGRYSGEYVVADTGEKIVGRRLDIYMPNERACRRFGRKSVGVKVIQMGDGTHQATKEAAKAVSLDVKRDLSKEVVGNAATQEDWSARTAVEKRASTVQGAQSPPIAGTSNQPK